MKKIAVIGSGMSGLAAAWFIGKEHDVTLFERQRQIGIGAHSVDLESGCVDVPLRVIYPGYYPELYSLLAEAGVAVEALDAALSFSDVDGACYFRYRNFRLPIGTLPLPSLNALRNLPARRILYDLSRFMRRVPGAYARGELAGATIGDYLRQQSYSGEFIDRFLIPCFSGINTVSNAAVEAYPAEHIAQYFTRGFVFSSVCRAAGGARSIADALSRRMARAVLDADLAAVRRDRSSVSLVLASGEASRFDAVVFATQANQVIPLLHDATVEEREVLGSFHYVPVKVLMHRDTRLAPCHQRDWAPVNYLMNDAHDRPMITIWVNALLPAHRGAQPVFQTINPHFDAESDKIIQSSELARPVVDLKTNAWIRRLNALQEDPDRRIYFCGSYAAEGIPLLESATVSARRVADRIRVAQSTWH